ncbi:MAG: hypothetical protein JWP83_2027 [Mycobacterium sp.]|jgi:hypothetical protein|nr:hypothetical protein [Mycobacterium sp.]
MRDKGRSRPCSTRLVVVSSSQHSIQPQALGQEEEVRERIKVRDGVGLLLNRGVMRNCVLVPLDPATGKVIGFD